MSTYGTFSERQLEIGVSWGCILPLRCWQQPAIARRSNSCQPWLQIWTHICVRGSSARRPFRSDPYPCRSPMCFNGGCSYLHELMDNFIHDEYIREITRKQPHSHQVNTWLFPHTIDKNVLGCEWKLLYFTHTSLEKLSNLSYFLRQILQFRCKNWSVVVTAGVILIAPLNKQLCYLLTLQQVLQILRNIIGNHVVGIRDHFSQAVFSSY